MKTRRDIQSRDVTRVGNDVRGFTILEVLIAVAVFSIGLLALGSLATTTIISTEGGRRTTQALNIAVQKMETLKGVRFKHLQISDNQGNLEKTCTGPLGTPPVFTCKASGGLDPFETINRMKFNWEYTVTYMNLNANAKYYSGGDNYEIDPGDMKKIVVTVSWSDVMTKAYASRSLVLSMVRSKL